MTQLIFTNGQMLVGSALVEGQALVVESGKIVAIVPTAEAPSHAAHHDLAGGTLLPGFVDLQVNGGGGALFNDDPSVETLLIIAAAHHRFGTTAFLPTLISDDLDKIRTAVSAVEEAIDHDIPGIVGIHIEGPFLNVRRKGIHDANKLRLLDESGLSAITGLTKGRTLVTLAPELAEPKYIQELTSAGILVAAGHTNASFDQINASFDAGVSGVTHLFNAMSQITPREPGAVGGALARPDCWCCIIVDGLHVHPATLNLAIRAKNGVDRFILVSDAMPTVGHTDKTFRLNGQEMKVINGVCRNADGTLAGSDLDMARAYGNAVAMLGLSVADASRMASANPAEWLGLGSRKGTIAPGFDADLVLLGSEGQVRETWISGNRVWPINGKVMSG